MRRGRPDKAEGGRRRPLVLLLGLLAALAAAGSGGGAARAEPQASLVVDAGSGAVLHAEAATARHYPASLTKLMTAYVVFDAVENGRLSFKERLSVSAAAAHQPPTRLGLRAGGEITVLQALQALLTRSANDAAVVLAEAVAGSEEEFARYMTHWARLLGMKRTRFANASGLPHPDQVTTAHDMAVLAMALMADFPQHFHFLSAPGVTYGGRIYPTYNSLLRAYPGVDGVKTGFTCSSGYNVLATARRDGRRLIVVVLGARSPERRRAEVTALLDEGFALAQGNLAGRLLLAALRGAPDLGPADVLSSDDCVKTASLAPEIDDGRLPGWGVLFGSFPTADEARSVAVERQKALTDVVGPSRTAIVRGARAGMTRYSALLVDLDQPRAGAACKRAWRDKVFCQALSPEALNNENAIWR